MSNFPDYFYLGKITKKHGYAGRVHIFLDTDEPWEYESLDMVMLNISGNLVPFFIDNININGNKALVDFSDIDTGDKADPIIDKEMYLPISLLPKLSGNKFYYHEAKGMIIIDSNKGEIGSVKTVLEYPNQAVFQVFHNEREVLIPISKEIISDFNRKEGKIYIVAPEGLLDIYLNP